MAKSRKAKQHHSPRPAPRSGALPPPFARPSPALEAFLACLDPRRIYITHVDAHAPAFKRQIFLVPLLTNVALVLGLLWRLYVAAPPYLAALVAALGDGPADGARPGVSAAAWFLLDWAVFTYVADWPRGFFLGRPASPVQWRWAVRFRPDEVVVRQSRRWAEALHIKAAADLADHAVIREKVGPALDEGWMGPRTGYAMMNADWELDFAGMLAAHEAVETEELKLADLRKSVFVHTPDVGWLVWEAWKGDGAAVDEDERQRRKIVVFKDRLTALGKESLFFRYVELLQAESAAAPPGAFTAAERRARAVARVAALFEREGVDMDSVGGVGEMPGLEALEGEG
ncbi:MAG: hypothetical protein M1832_006096 [Thelocarpon impressellum]|nr:MAG: hypothetical protein M1832_006096 [Thelocarpon impressellum]